MARKSSKVQSIESMSYIDLRTKLDALTADDLDEDMLWVAAEIEMTVDWGTAAEKAEIHPNRQTWAAQIGILAEQIRGENVNGVKGTTYGDICAMVRDNHGW